MNYPFEKFHLNCYLDLRFDQIFTGLLIYYDYFGCVLVHSCERKSACNAGEVPLGKSELVKKEVKLEEKHLTFKLWRERAGKTVVTGKARKSAFFLAQGKASRINIAGWIFHKRVILWCLFHC